MEMIWQGILAAIHLLITGDPEVIEITLLTLKISGTGTLISLLIGIPFGTFLALKPFPGRRFVLSVVNTGMGLPPVVVGPVSYTHLRAHETGRNLVCRLLLEK